MHKGMSFTQETNVVPRIMDLLETWNPMSPYTKSLKMVMNENNVMDSTHYETPKSSLKIPMVKSNRKQVDMNITKEKLIPSYVNNELGKDVNWKHRFISRDPRSHKFSQKWIWLPRYTCGNGQKAKMASSTLFVRSSMELRPTGRSWN